MTSPDDLTLELTEELEAFDPKWQEHYPTLAIAAEAADVLGLYQQWITTPDGVKYLGATRGVPDRVGESRAAAEQLGHPRSLPFGYDTLGWLPKDAWGE
jgi:hypothetical protein